jgi:NAD(P)-dependent dehydrogenase (short-subunit alcohol dehydrogenase family)
MRLTGHHALITGGGTGIGAAIARALGAEGAKLTLVGRRRDKLDAVAAELDALAAPGDVTRSDELEACFATGRARHGPVTILVNNAGGSQSAPFARVTRELWRQTMALNLDAVFDCCQMALPDLLAAECGRIVNISSIAGMKPYPYVAAYVAAKHGVIGLTRALALELIRTRVTANAVCPGFTDTDLVAESIATIQAKTGRSEAEARAEIEKFNPQGGMIAPREIAAAVLWLCLPESRAVTGQSIVVAGGEIM